MQESEKYWVWLASLKGISLIDKHKLLNELSSIEIHALTQAQIEQIINKKTPIKLDFCLIKATKKCLLWLKEEISRKLLVWSDNAYPSMLRQIHAPPLVLYIDGDLQAIKAPQIAIVGSRKCSAYGKKVALELSSSLSGLGITITSGLAIGIDGVAHEGALKSSGKTIAVLANGLDRVYPQRHVYMAQEIIKQGCLISEFPLGMPPLRANFPRRNRIIAGLSMGVVVVEAEKASGSLITARLASEQGKQIFAVPGSIYSAQTEGCHYLIDQGAKLLSNVNDVLEELHIDIREAMPSLIKSIELDEKYQNLMGFIGIDPISSEEIINQSGLTSEQVSAMLLELELKCHIVRDNFGLFVRC